MATMTDLCNTRPAVGEGVPTGRGIWRLVVQVAAATGAVWGAEYGYVCGSPTVWSDGWEWVDITDSVRGFSYQRGMGSVADRPRVGTCTIELDNNDGAWSTWKRYTYPYLDVGSVMRIVVDTQVGDTMDSDWWPRFTGRVESIDDLTTDLDADRRVVITLAETISDLARVDDVAINGDDGYGDAVIQRLRRLTDRAGWPFPTDGLTADATYIWDHDADVYQHVTLQPTNYAQNRLTEVYLTADSATSHVFTDRNGGLRIASAWAPAMGPTNYYFGEISTTAARWVVPWHDLAITADEEGIVTDAQIAAAGSTVSEYRIPGKTGRVSYQRNDLIFLDTVPAWAVAAHIAERIVEDIRNYRQTQRAVVRLDVLTDDVVWDGIMGTDILQTTIVFREMTRFGGTDARQLTGYVMAETHNVTPLNDGNVVWAAEYLLHVTDNDPFTDYP